MRYQTGSKVKMAKISKSSLKNAVKECLIEILQEGLTESAVLTESSRSMSARGKNLNDRRIPEHSRQNVYDKMVVHQRQPQVQQANFNQMTDDPIMAGIFADTARTTMVEQVAAERHGVASQPIPAGRADAATMQAAQSDPTDLFGESASNWAALAFSDTKKLK